jgi:LysR family transcriptional regulator, low CO2-responsive transcriptional regulator
MPNYTLRQLLTFIEVARESSVSRAAERLFVTQPAVSMQLKQLEEAFGVALVEPIGRNIRLTHAGQDFLTHATAALGALKDLEATMADHVGMKHGRLDLAVVSTAKYFVPMLLMRFRTQHAGIEVVLRVENRDKVVGMLSRNEVDLVVMGRPPEGLRCEATPFATNPLGVLCAPEHPLARLKKVRFEAVAECDFLVREEGSGTRAAMERLFTKHKAKMKVTMELPSNETIKRAVMAGMGLGFLSLRTVRHELAAGHLVLLDVPGLPLLGHWYVTHLDQKKLSPVTRAFKAFLLEQGGPLVDAWA